MTTIERLTALVFALTVLAVPSTAFGQGGLLPNLPSELVNRQLHIDGDIVRLCYNPDALLAGFDTAYAKAIGDALLLEVRLVDVKTLRVSLPYDYRLPLNYDQLYVVMQQECDGFLGFTLASESYPEWLTISTSYLSTRMVLVTFDAAISNLEDMKFDRRIGARGSSAADTRLLTYLATRPPGRRWVRNVYYDNLQLMNALRAGAIGAALIWEPALRALTNGGPKSAGLRELAIPFSTDPVEFGIVLNSNDTFLRQVFSQGIAVLQADGTTDRLLEGALAAIPKTDQ